MKIYTKTGDSGLTGLVGGGRIPKTSLRINAIGDVDELNACLGLSRVLINDLELTNMLEEAQNRLFDLGSELACPPEMRDRNAFLTEAHVGQLEHSIDRLSDQLPPLRNFILPAGSEAAARLHLARCVCRRAERSVLAFQENQSIRPVIIQYLNRLSDWLFMAARRSNVIVDVSDVEWQKA